MAYVIKFINLDDPKDVRTGEVFVTRAEAAAVYRSCHKLMCYAWSVFGEEIVNSRYIRLIAKAE